MFYPVLDLDEVEGLPDCPSYPPREMFKLVIYSFYRGVTSIEMLAEMAKFHQIVNPLILTATFPLVNALPFWVNFALNVIGEPTVPFEL